MQPVAARSFVYTHPLCFAVYVSAITESCSANEPTNNQRLNMIKAWSVYRDSTAWATSSIAFNITYQYLVLLL